jgi:uncharacterized protein with NAD-binding domain and iron-sulfur cluster
MVKKVIIIGGGISGLTTAHELIKKDFDVHLFESSFDLGGMAKCVRNKYGIIEEYSWRGYGSFYNNFFDIAKQIPINNSHKPNHPLLKHNNNNNNKPCVINNLSHNKLNFILFNNNDIYDEAGEMDFTEYIKGYYDISKYICSNNRREEDKKILLKDYIIKNYNKKTYNIIVNHICGPGLGFNRHTVSKKIVLDTITSIILNSNIDTYHNWRVSTRSTTESWFEPWKEYLTNHNNFKLYFNSTLIKINKINDKITSLTMNIDGRVQHVYADEYVISINPFNLQNILVNSNLKVLQEKNKKVISKSVNNQISFRFGFIKKIKFHKENIAITFLDSMLNITIQIVESCWDKDVRLDNNGEIKSLWSGTIVDSTSILPKYNKQIIELTREELIEEIKNEIFISKSLNNYIYKYNNFYLTRDDIYYEELFNEYEYINGKLENLHNKKWVNDIFNDSYIMDQQTEYTNMYIGGAHTKTSLNKYSMEAATESGKIIANHILTKYNYDKCYHYVFNNKYFYQLDDSLYSVHGPSIVSVLLVFIIFLIILILVKLYLNRYKQKIKYSNKFKNTHRRMSLKK